MFLKWIKKRLPKPSEISKNKNLSWFGKTIYNKELWSITRHSVATGVSVGLFVAFIPLPIQMLCATALAVLFKGNVVIAIATTFISNPITFLPLTYFIYKVGQIVTNDQTEFDSTQALDVHNAQIIDLILQFFERFQSLGKSILIGLPIVSFSAAIISYILINLFWNFIVPKSKRVKKPKAQNS